MVQLLPILHLTILSLIIYQPSLASGADNPTKGFARVHLDSSNFIVEKPYDVAVDERYSFINGVHRFWVYSTGKPHMPSSNTKPRTEIRITGRNYTSGVWQFEGYGYVPSGTTGVCIMQMFGGTSSATTLQLRVYNGSLTYYRSPVMAENIYDRWFKVNAIHDVGASSVKVYINGVLKYEGADRGAGTHYFKFGVTNKMILPTTWNLSGKISKFLKRKNMTFHPHPNPNPN
uniref:Alginate lyase 2 domain-containing protein n=1 Tax=Lotus japonicus TaxID=34305 RepID=I3SC51_LOTJA|nr:unknown [Lotus japonicus]